MTSASARLVRRRRRDERTNHERWLVSYADFITLLFAFFTTMYAISTVDAQKLGTIVQALQVAFDTKGLPGRVHEIGMAERAATPVATQALTTGIMQPTTPATALDAAPPRRRVLAEHGQGMLDTTLNEVRGQLSERFRSEIADGRLDVSIDRRGLVISIKEAGSFGMGSADLSDTSRAMLADIAEILRGISNQVRVEGHTDDIPIHTARYASNWELSTARATNVVAYLIEREGLAPTRLSAAGYAEFHPRGPNDSAASRALNRRVDIVVLNPRTSAAEEPGGRRE